MQSLSKAARPFFLQEDSARDCELLRTCTSSTFLSLASSTFTGEDAIHHSLTPRPPTSAFASKAKASFSCMAVTRRHAPSHGSRKSRLDLVTTAVLQLSAATLRLP